MLERGAASQILAPRAAAARTHRVSLFKELSLEDTDCDLTLVEKEELGEYPFGCCDVLSMFVLSK